MRSPFAWHPDSPLHKTVHPLLRKGVMHWVRFVVLLLLGTWLGHVLSESERYADIRYSIYQHQTRMQRRGAVYPQHTVLVLLDDDDYWGEAFQSRDPLKRDQLAALVDKLNAAGVNVVALDLNFFSPRPEKPDYDYPDYRAEDAVLMNSLRAMCANGRHVVMGSAVEYAAGGKSTEGNSVYAEKPLIFTSALKQLPCVSTGYVELPDDMRKIPGLIKLDTGRDMDSFALSILKIADTVAYADVVKNHERGFRFAQFLGPEDFSPRGGRQFIFNGEAIRTMDVNALRNAVADRTVIVGTHWHPFAYGVGGYFLDMHLSPGGEQPGAMLHANYVEAMQDRTGTFTPISDRTGELIELAMVLALAWLGALDIHAGWKWGGFVISCVLSIVLTYVLLQNLGLFLDFLIPFLMIVVHTIAEELLEMRRELHHARHQLKEKS